MKAPSITSPKKQIPSSLILLLGALLSQVLFAQSPIVITEINYNPYQEPGSAVDNDEYEFIELHNIGNSAISLSGFDLVHYALDALGARDVFQFRYNFSAGDSIPAGGYYIVARYVTRFTERYSSPYSYSGSPATNGFASKLKNSGGVVVLEDNGTEVTEVLYQDGGSWPSRADGDGSSAELRDLTGVPLTSDADKNAYLSSGKNWRSSSEFHGSPGRAGLGADNRVEINEVLSNTVLPMNDAIELYNGSGSAQDISGWVMSDSATNYAAYQFPPNTVIPAGGFATYLQDGSPSGLPFGISSSRGDDVYLIETDDAGNLLRFVDKVSVPATINGESYGRLPDGGGDIVPLLQRTLGEPNATGSNRVRVGCVVITEVHYNPAGVDDNLEFVEITNMGTETVRLHDSSLTPAPAWELRGEVDHTFNNNESLAPGESIVLVGFDPATGGAAFQSHYGVSGLTMVKWDLAAKLSNSGGNLRLERPGELQPAVDIDPAFYPEVEEDLTEYGDGASWPASADDGGESLHRANASFDGTKSTAWEAGLPTPGTFSGILDFGLVTTRLTPSENDLTIEFLNLPCIQTVTFYESSDLVNWATIGNAAVSQQGTTPHRASVTVSIDKSRNFIRAGK